MTEEEVERLLRVKFDQVIEVIKNNADLRQDILAQLSSAMPQYGSHIDSLPRENNASSDEPKTKMVRRRKNSGEQA
jgi:hypothetical protein